LGKGAEKNERESKEECGGTYTGKTNTSGKGYKTRYYVCNNKYRTHTCDAQNINADEI
jgi:hypothetical protein